MKHISKIKSTKLGFDPDQKEQIEFEEYCDFTADLELEKASKEYNYLLNLPMSTLTMEKVSHINKQIKQKKE